MDRVDIVFLVLLVAGLAFLWVVPTGPTYEVGSNRAPDITPDEVTAFEELDTDARQEFLDVLGDNTIETHEEPALANYTRYVRYEGVLYEVYIGVRSGTVRSFFVPIIGRVLVGISGLWFGGRLLSWWFS